MNRKTSHLIHLIHCLICLMFLTLSLPGIVNAASERRTALVIGNGVYSSSPLKNPVNDAADMATNLQRLGFSVTLKMNASHQEMEDAIRDFGDQLKKGGVGLFFYAGHGVQISGRNYLIPVGARINRDTDVKFQAVDTEIVLAEMGNAGNNLNIVILDACRDNPFVRSFRTGSRGLAIISDAPRGTLITYSTSPGKVAADGSGRNSPYTESLIRHMNTTGLPIEEVFKEVRRDLGRKTRGRQVPWELSSLEGQFYFSPGKQSSPIISSATDKLSVEQRQIEAERDRMRRERELFEQQEALEEEKRILEEKKKKLAMGGQSSIPSAKEIKRDGRFIAYDNGTVLDTSTSLMWATADNGYDINWQNAKDYCDNYRVGGYTDWRMPTQGELAGLYDPSKSGRGVCDQRYEIHVATKLIDITCFGSWASETRGADAANFFFNGGERGWYRQTIYYRVLPVRNAK